MSITKEEEDEEADIHLIITGNVINEDGIVTEEHFLNDELIEDFTELQGRVVFTELGSVQSLFYSETERKHT